MHDGVEHRPPNALPARRLRAGAVALERQNPSHRIAPPARDRVTQQGDGLILRQSWLRTRANFPQRRNGIEQSRAREGIHFGVELFEETEVERDTFPTRERARGLARFGGRKSPLHGVELLRRARLHVMLPVRNRRPCRRVPRGVPQPKERRAVGVFKVFAIARYLDRTVFAETRITRRRTAQKLARLLVQTRVRRIRAHGVIPPTSREIRREAHAPRLAAIPKTVCAIRLAQRRDEQHAHLGFLQRIRVGVAALKREFKAFPLGHHWHLRCTGRQAKVQSSAAHCGQNQSEQFAFCHVRFI